MQKAKKAKKKEENIPRDARQSVVVHREQNVYFTILNTELNVLPWFMRGQGKQTKICYLTKDNHNNNTETHRDQRLPRGEEGLIQNRSIY